MSSIRIDCTEGLRLGLGYEIADFVNEYSVRNPKL